MRVSKETIKKLVTVEEENFTLTMNRKEAEWLVFYLGSATLIPKDRSLVNLLFHEEMYGKVQSVVF